MGVTCRRFWEKKGQYIKKFEMLYFTTLASSPRCTEFYRNRFGGISPGRNHIFIISYQPERGFWFCEGSNFAISHRKAWSAIAVNTVTALPCSPWSQTIRISADSHTQNPCLMRWSLALQPYRFTVHFICGTENVTADHLSHSSE